MKSYLLFLLGILYSTLAWAQGPPITADKPIMLGGKSFTIKTLTEIRNTERVQGKYQFYRKDYTGKTFRVVAKTLQTLPTGKELDLIGQSTHKYQGYYGVVSGYETLKYGISTEVGYNWSPIPACGYMSAIGISYCTPRESNML